VTATTKAMCPICGAWVYLVGEGGPARCEQHPSEQLVNPQPVEQFREPTGIIYILSNPSMHGLLKIGYTTKSLQARVVELNNATGIPTAFAVEAFFEVDGPETLERRIHEVLKGYRVRKQREFFKMERGDAIKIVGEICRAPALCNSKIAPKRSPNYRNPRWLSPEKQEFNAIRKELWKVRKEAFENRLLADPTSRRPPPVTFRNKLREFFRVDDHDFRAVSRDRLNTCHRVVYEMRGYLKRPYGRTGYVLSASKYSIARVYISSAVDLDPERLKLILAELKREEEQISAAAKEIYEKRHRQVVV